MTDTPTDAESRRSVSRGREAFVSPHLARFPLTHPILHSNPLGEAGLAISGTPPYLGMPAPPTVPMIFPRRVAASLRFTPTESVFPPSIRSSIDMQPDLFRRTRGRR